MDFTAERTQKKKGLLVLILFECLSFFVFFPRQLLSDERLQIQIQRVSIFPKIDGYLEKSFWGDITPLEGFVQYDPYNGELPSEKTSVYIAYDENNLYIAFNCLDSQPAGIKADLTPREKFSANDSVSVIIDTFFDKRNYYLFEINPRGIQKDRPGDYLWESAAVIHKEGWSAEIMLPFKSIRFPTGSAKSWGINFKRYIFHEKETCYLTQVGRDDVLLEKSAVLTGLEGIRSGKHVEFFPYAGFRNSATGDEKDSEFAVGLDAKYAVTSNLYLDLTTSPDFSEVESDPFFYQLTPYEYYLREKRPFFQESGRYFIEDLFYSKRVTNPKFAFKLTGKEKGYSLGLLGALNKAGDQNEYFGVFNIKKDIFSLSSLSVAYAGYKTDAFTNQNGGLSLDLRFSKKTQLYFTSYLTYNSDMEKKNNGHYWLGFGYFPDEGLSFWGALRRIEKNYLPRAGFYWAQDYQFLRLSPGYAKRINKYGVKKVEYHFNCRFDQDSSGNDLGYSLVPVMLWVEFLKELNIGMNYSFGRRKTQVWGEEGLEWTENFFKSHSFGMFSGYSGSRFFSFETSIWYELGPVYNQEYTEAFDGKTVELVNELVLKPTSSLNVSLNLNYTRQNIRATGEEIFEGLLASANIRYQLSRAIFLSSYVQHDSYFKRLNVDVLLGIELGMGNEIYLTYKGFFPFEGSPFQNSARSFVVKASYLIRL